MTLTVSFFQNGKKNNGKALISIKILLFLKTIMASCANVPATGLDFVYNKGDCQDHQFLLLKHQDQCLVIVSCKTLNLALP